VNELRQGQYGSETTFQNSSSITSSHYHDCFIATIHSPHVAVCPPRVAICKWIAIFRRHLCLSVVATIMVGWSFIKKKNHVTMSHINPISRSNPQTIIYAPEISNSEEESSLVHARCQQNFQKWRHHVKQVAPSHHKESCRKGTSQQ
jgi:hypothetical protein